MKICDVIENDVVDSRMAIAKRYRIHRRTFRMSMLTALCMVLLMTSGCSVVGPRSISMGRANYNDAIDQTENEQMLLAIVKGRYGETFSLLAVSGVAANMRFRASAGIDVGFGPSDNYDGNLVPFSGGVAVEENPTITYKPIQGEQYVRHLLSPIPLNMLVLILRSETHSATYLTLIANRINDMQNPDFSIASSAGTASRFQRFVDLSQELGQAGVLQLVVDPRKDIVFDILISNYVPTHTDKVREYIELAGLSMPADKSSAIVVPVHFAVKAPDWSGLAVSTRSTYDLLEILRASIQTPQEHADAGLTRNYPPPGLAGKDIRIQSSKDKPKRASTAVAYRGYWFYVDETDMQTKLFFDLARTLWSISISASADQKAAPVLTIPVSR